MRITANAPGAISVTGEFKKLNILACQGDVAVGAGKVDTANFDMRNDSKLTVDDVPIGKANYKLSEKAKVSLSGLSAKPLKH